MWGNTPSRIYGRFLKPAGFGAEDAVIRLDGGWDGFLSGAPSGDSLARMRPDELAEEAGIEPGTFTHALEAALRAWRVSPSRSLINLLEQAGEGQAGDVLFSSLACQTRVLAAAIESETVREGDLLAVSGGDGKRLRISGDAYAMTAAGDVSARINALARAFRLWEERNRTLVAAGLVKLPKTLFRGIRSRDVALPRAAEEGSVDEPWNFRSCRIVAAKADAISSQILAETSKTGILSFTANERIAELFTRQEGFVIEIDPADMSTVCSWATDEGLAGKDMVTGRQEREWIMRVGNLVPAPERVRFHDRKVAWSTADPRGVAMLDGTARATYEMAGRHVEAYFSWNSTGTGGQLRFRIDGGFGETRAEAKKAHGFDPLPGPDSDVSCLAFRECTVSGFGNTRPYEIWEREPGTSAPRPL